MIFTSLSKASLVLIASSLVLLLSPSVESHSYADCVDWRFNAGSKSNSWSNKNGHCAGYARRFPLNAKPFAKLDSDDPNRHYQQTHKNPDPNHAVPCSNGKVGVEPGADETMGHPISQAYSGKDARGRKTGQMTVTKAGSQLCVRWPAKNHAIPSEPNHPVTIAFSGVNPTKDPTQQEFIKSKHLFNLQYKNCTDKGKDTDIWPCGGCFTVPKDMQAGNYVMQWRWQLNPNEFYASCADISVGKK
ncbi:hypothetical protein EDD21DRAFT_381237 [Dissophora ornata]|nr:hypothetical protein BGZ58_005380 [Dissophora ornata]KAI8598885.1 hypothetical protein EDD21DRAFT_381237 [Dissophora ornata]